MSVTPPEDRRTYPPPAGKWEARRSFRSGDVTEGWFAGVLGVRRLLPAKWLVRAGWLGCPRLILSSFSDGDLEKNSDFFFPQHWRQRAIWVAMQPAPVPSR